MSLLKGNRLLYSGAIISIGFATLFTYASPLVLRSTIDSIIGDKPLTAPHILTKLFTYLGGVTILRQKLWYAGLLLVVIALFRGCFNYLTGRWSAKASETIALKLRNDLYARLQKVPVPFYYRFKTGDLVQRCTSDVETIRKFFGVILYGKLTATVEEIKIAVKSVYCHEFITQLPKKYDTEITEGGTNISAGQKQLISLARTVLANPALLIMDEATSSVDSEVELQIQKAMEKLVKGRTSIIIAHRLSTIREADRILVIESGQIAEDGNHKELITKKGKYYKYYYHQFQDQAAIMALRDDK